MAVVKSVATPTVVSSQEADPKCQAAAATKAICSEAVDCAMCK